MTLTQPPPQIEASTPPQPAARRIGALVAQIVGTIALLSGLGTLLFSPLGAVHPISQRITPEAAAANVPTVLPADIPPLLSTGTSAIIHVPADVKTIQGAVDQAVPGQMILIAPGIYHEAVVVKKPHLTIRGADRNTVILDGHQGDAYLSNGIYAQRGGDNTIVENLTVRNYAGNGIYWNAVTGYRSSYVTVYNNGDYGIYAFDSTRGQLDHSYAAGSPDSGIYIGQCFPCDALVTHNISEHSGLGYSGTNAGGNLVLRDSVWRYNGAGIMPNSLDSEKRPPERQTTIVHNLVYDNNDDQAPSFPIESVPFGTGIATPGGESNLIADNIIQGHQNYGVMIVSIIDDNLYTPSGNTVIRNQISGSGVADLALATPAGPDNCFSENQVAKTVPPMLQTTNACGTPGARRSGGDLGVLMHMLGKFASSGALGKAFFGAELPTRVRSWADRWKTYPAPTEQFTSMPSSVTTPPQGIFTESWIAGSFDSPVPGSINSTKAVAAVGFSSFLEVLLGFYTYLLPIAIYAAWVGIALWDLARRETLKAAPRYGWMAGVLGVPVVGAIAYYALGRPQLTVGFRWMLVGGALAIWLGATIILLFAAAHS